MEKIIYPCLDCKIGNKFAEETGIKKCKVNCEKYKTYCLYLEKKYQKGVKC